MENLTPSQVTLNRVDAPIDDRQSDFMDEVKQAYNAIAVTPKEPRSNVVRVYRRSRASASGLDPEAVHHEDLLIKTIYKVGRKHGYTPTKSGTENVEDAWERSVSRDPVWQDLDFDEEIRYIELTPVTISETISE